MNVRKRVVGSIFAAGLVGLTAAWVRSAPIMGQAKAKVTDSILSVGRIDTIRLDIRPMPDDMAALGITTDSVRNRWSKALERANMRVLAADDDAEAVGTLKLSVASGVDEEASPDAVLCYLLLSFQQPVRLDRFERSLFVPTYYKVIADITPKDALEVSLNDNLNFLVEHFITHARKADRWWISVGQGAPDGR